MVVMHNDLKKETLKSSLLSEKRVGIFIQLIIGPMNFSKTK
jgi:hypothetical protein